MINYRIDSDSLNTQKKNQNVAYFEKLQIYFLLKSHFVHQYSNKSCDPFNEIYLRNN